MGFKRKGDNYYWFVGFEYEEICQEEIEIVNAIQRKDYDYIDRCLKNNKKYNLEILRKIGLDINRRG